MKTLFAVDFAENAIVASKTTLKKASVPGSPEYKTLMKLIKQNPTFSIKEKDIKKAVSKETYEGLTKKFIEKYISIQSNFPELNEQYAKANEMGKFPLVRKWFLGVFKNFNMELAKEEILNHELAIINAVCAKKEANSSNNTPTLVEVDNPVAA